MAGMIRIADALQAVAVTLWVGGLWAIGFLVAPSLFHALDDRALAGDLAGRFFTLIACIGFVCGTYLLLYGLLRSGAAALKHAFFWLALAMMLLVAAGQFGVQPVLADLRAQALPNKVMDGVVRDRFAAWHGVASVLYLLESVLGLAMVLLQTKSPR